MYLAENQLFFTPFIYFLFSILHIKFMHFMLEFLHFFHKFRSNRCAFMRLRAIFQTHWLIFIPDTKLDPLDLSFQLEEKTAGPRDKKLSRTWLIGALGLFSQVTSCLIAASGWLSFLLIRIYILWNERAHIE